MKHKKKIFTKQSSQQHTCQRMSRADVAEYFNRSLPWVDRAAKNGLIPPAVRIGAPFWLKNVLDDWVQGLAAEAIEKAKEAKEC